MINKFLNIGKLINIFVCVQQFDPQPSSRFVY